LQKLNWRNIALQQLREIVGYPRRKLMQDCRGIGMSEVKLCVAFLSVAAVITMAQSAPGAKTVYDGKWWLSASQDRQAGFLEGAADCLTWVAHEEGFNGTAHQLQGRVNAYYKEHPEQQSMLVTEVWQEVWANLTKTQGPSKETSGRESWSNAHWYLDGNWWGQGSTEEKKGFIEGFLWCMRSRVKQGVELYPRPNSHYFNKVDQYIRSHPDSENKPVANILARFRAQPTSK
jgi:hypothetical protein